MRSALRLSEEGSAFFGVVAELMTEDAKSARRVAETPGDIGGGFLVNEESPEGFVLALQGGLGGLEEIAVGRWCYLIGSAGLHISIVLQKHSPVNMFGRKRARVAQEGGAIGARRIDRQGRAKATMQG